MLGLATARARSKENLKNPQSDVITSSRLAWADGFGSRFGPLCVDYATQQCTPKLSASFYREVAAETGWYSP
jgi:hypothetical protein